MREGTCCVYLHVVLNWKEHAIRYKVDLYRDGFAFGNHEISRKWEIELLGNLKPHSHDTKHIWTALNSISYGKRKRFQFNCHIAMHRKRSVRSFVVCGYSSQLGSTTQKKKRKYLKESRFPSFIFQLWHFVCVALLFNLLINGLLSDSSKAILMTRFVVVPCSGYGSFVYQFVPC